jgi:DNA ligase 1
MDRNRRILGAAAAAGCVSRWSLARLLFMGGAVAAASPVAARGLPLLLAEEAPELERLDVGRYLVSEKLDGVRASWDGQSLRFRSGAAVDAPPDWLKSLPAQPLDGELWLGRSRFEQVSALTRRQGGTLPQWSAVRYVVFELPGAEGTFQDRVAQLLALHRRQGVPSWVPAEQRRLTTAREVQAWHDEVLRQGGEGLMLHLAEAPYLTGRRPELLKLKPWQDDEATVIAHLPGRGRHAGRVGALRVRDRLGAEFSLGSGLSDAEREVPPPVGARVTYRYRGRTSRGLPRFATFWRVSPAL